MFGIEADKDSRDQGSQVRLHQDLREPTRELYNPPEPGRGRGLNPCLHGGNSGNNNADVFET